MARSDCFRLTEYAKTDLLSELNLTVNAKSDCDLIKWDSFPEKKLVYNVSEKKQVMELSSILSAERFSEVQSRLRNVGMRAGFCCLFMVRLVRERRKQCIRWRVQRGVIFCGWMLINQELLGR